MVAGMRERDPLERGSLDLDPMIPFNIVRG